MMEKGLKDTSQANDQSRAGALEALNELKALTESTIIQAKELVLGEMSDVIAIMSTQPISSASKSQPTATPSPSRSLTGRVILKRNPICSTPTAHPLVTTTRATRSKATNVGGSSPSRTQLTSLSMEKKKKAAISIKLQQPVTTSPPRPTTPTNPPHTPDRMSTPTRPRRNQDGLCTPGKVNYQANTEDDISGNSFTPGVLHETGASGIRSKSKKTSAVTITSGLGTPDGSDYGDDNEEEDNDEALYDSHDVVIESSIRTSGPPSVHSYSPEEDLSTIVHYNVGDEDLNILQSDHESVHSMDQRQNKAASAPIPESTTSIDNTVCQQPAIDTSSKVKIPIRKPELCSIKEGADKSMGHVITNSPAVASETMVAPISHATSGVIDDCMTEVNQGYISHPSNASGNIDKHTPRCETRICGVVHKCVLQSVVSSAVTKGKKELEDRIHNLSEIINAMDSRISRLERRNTATEKNVNAMRKTDPTSKSGASGTTKITYVKMKGPTAPKGRSSKPIINPGGKSRTAGDADEEGLLPDDSDTDADTDNVNVVEHDRTRSSDGEDDDAEVSAATMDSDGISDKLRRRVGKKVAPVVYRSSSGSSEDDGGGDVTASSSGEDDSPHRVKSRVILKTSNSRGGKRAHPVKRATKRTRTATKERSRSGSVDREITKKRLKVDDVVNLRITTGTGEVQNIQGERHVTATTVEESSEHHRHHRDSITHSKNISKRTIKVPVEQHEHMERAIVHASRYPVITGPDERPAIISQRNVSQQSEEDSMDDIAVVPGSSQSLDNQSSIGLSNIDFENIDWKNIKF